MYLGKNLKYLRLKNNFSQEEIASLCGYKSFTTIQKWESGISEPSIGVLSKLADLFKVDLDDMVSIDIENESRGAKPDMRYAAKMANGFDLEDLTAEDIDEIRRFIEFKKSKNKESSDE